MEWFKFEDMLKILTSGRSMVLKAGLTKIACLTLSAARVGTKVRMITVVEMVLFQLRMAII